MQKETVQSLQLHLINQTTDFCVDVEESAPSVVQTLRCLQSLADRPVDDWGAQWTGTSRLVWSPDVGMYCARRVRASARV
mmetsp:Transcript_7708/g.21039  ORF Transcript_7708/g.21039 Transcript_7708/m.21039 type:complete len:80 (-) Transcript_7708:28-267(-)